MIPLLEAIFVLGFVMADQPARTQVTWRLPATIEALRDVTVQRFDRSPANQPHPRDVLSGQSHDAIVINGEQDPTVIRKGKLFLMVEILEEGGCTIEFERHRFTLSSCWWLDGFTDHREDVFKVVAGRTRSPL